MRSMVRPISRCCSSPTHETVRCSPQVLLATTVDTHCSYSWSRSRGYDMFCEVQVGIVSSESGEGQRTFNTCMTSLRANLRRTRPMPLLKVETVTPSGTCAAGRPERPLSNRQPVLGGRRSYFVNNNSVLIVSVSGYWPGR